MPVWKPVPSLHEYIASSDGEIMRVPYVAPMVAGGVRTYGGQPIRGVLRGDRYFIQFRGKNYRVHRLVCEAFHGPPPFDGAVAMHLNSDPTDNRPENLAWGTQRENLNHPDFIAYCRSRTGENSPIAKARARRSA